MYFGAFNDFLLSFSDRGGLKAQKHVSFKTGLWLVMGYGPYVKLVLTFLFTSLAFLVIKTLEIHLKHVTFVLKCLVVPMFISVV